MRVVQWSNRNAAALSSAGSLLRIFRKPKGTKRGQRGAGIGKLSFRTFSEAEFVAAPAAVAMLYVEEMLKSPAEPAVGGISHMAKHVGGMDALARVYRALRVQLETPVLPPRIEYQVRHFLQNGFGRLHAQLQHHRTSKC